MKSRARRSRSRAAPLVLALLAAGCARAELLHGLEERQANQVLVALDEAGVRAEKRRDEASESGWLVEVPGADAARARRLLAERELPRPEPAGLGAAYAKPSMVPTPAEERARFLHALAGELSRSIEAIEGVAEARVHLALPVEDPLRAAAPGAPRGAVLVKLRPGARARVEPLAPGIRALVAGSVTGLEAAEVAVVLAEGTASTPDPPAPGRARPVLVGLGLLALALALLLLLLATGVLPRFLPPGRRARRMA